MNNNNNKTTNELIKANIRPDVEIARSSDHETGSKRYFQCLSLFKISGFYIRNPNSFIIFIIEIFYKYL